MINYYELLGVSEKANASEIKQAYQKKAMAFHPDRNQGSRQAEEIFKLMQIAYDILSDDKKRKSYDYQLHRYSRQEGFGQSEYHNQNTQQRSYSQNTTHQHNQTQNQNRKEASTKQKNTRNKSEPSFYDELKTLKYSFLIILLLLFFIGFAVQSSKTPYIKEGNKPNKNPSSETTLTLSNFLYHRPFDKQKKPHANQASFPESSVSIMKVALDHPSVRNMMNSMYGEQNYSSIFQCWEAISKDVYSDQSDMTTFCMKPLDIHAVIVDHENRIYLQTIGYRMKSAEYFSGAFVHPETQASAIGLFIINVSKGKIFASMPVLKLPSDWQFIQDKPMELAQMTPDGYLGWISGMHRIKEGAIQEKLVLYAPKGDKIVDVARSFPASDNIDQYYYDYIIEDHQKHRGVYPIKIEKKVHGKTVDFAKAHFDYALWRYDIDKK